ncbi:MAG: thioesterase family protein [Streptosporangiaceae bacterium]
MPDAFYQPLGGGSFLAMPATAGPWSHHAQHGGPPSALAGRALELHEPAEGQRLARVAVDILRPVPVTEVTVRTRTLRAGRRVSLLEAVMEAGGREVLHARGWRIATSDAVPVVTKPSEPRAIPAERGTPHFFGRRPAGYLSVVDWRFVTGGFTDSGPSQAWGRPDLPLLDGEELTPMCRALLLADTGSGIGAAIDASKFQFINVDLTVVLQRDPVGEWLLLDSVTTMGGQGTGLAESTLSDTEGVVGIALQTLVVAPWGEVSAAAR